MKRADFFASMHTAAPGSTPEAVQKLIDFAVECVQEEQYANFTPSKDPEASVERWLDTLCGGVYAVRAEYGAELTGKLVSLGLDNCCLYPGEMLQAAACLRDGGTAETIFPRTCPPADRAGLRPGNPDPGAGGPLRNVGPEDGTRVCSVEWYGPSGKRTGGKWLL